MTVRQPSLILRYAVWLRGTTKPECTRLRRVPPSLGARVKVTTVSSSEP
jgi:hypothetical protein